MAFPTLPPTVPPPSKDLPSHKPVAQIQSEGGGISVLVFPMDDVVNDIPIYLVLLYCYAWQLFVTRASQIQSFILS